MMPTGELSAILGGALPDVMIHSHPIQEATGPDGKHASSSLVVLLTD